MAPKPVVAGWAGDPRAEDRLVDDTQTINEHQLRNAQNAPDGVSMNDINKAPGSGEVKLGSTPMGVWEGTPEAMGYDKMIEEMRLTRPVETDEERRSRLKRQRRNSLFAAIGDGISALSNLYFTTQGSPSADESKTMSKALTDRYDKEDKERETEEKSRLSTLLSVLNQKRLARSSWLARKNQAELIELRKKAAEAGNQAALKKIDELRRYHTELAQIVRENKKAEQERKDQEAKQREKESEERIANNRRRTQIYGSGVANQNANRNASTADKAKHNREMESQGRARLRNSGRGGNGGYNTSETVSWYDDQGRKHSKTTRGNSGGIAPKKKTLRKNNMGL
jgi:hypothetical protein